MPKKLPESINDLPAFAEFTSTGWRDQDTFYSLWVRRWKRTLDFIRGDHWNVLQQTERDKIPAWKRFPVINYTQMFYNDYLRQLLEARVRYSAVPTSPDSEDISGAELMEQVLKYVYDITDMDSKRTDLAAWVASCGTAYLRYFWDTNTGDMLPLGIPTPDGGLIPVDPDTLEVDPTLTSPMMVDKGEIGCEVVSPQLVRWGAKESDGVMIGMLLTFDELFDRYGEDVADKVSYSKTHVGLSNDISYGSSPNTENQQAERALIIEQYLPKSARFPQGLWWTVALDSKSLITRPNPLPSGKIPIATFRWIPVPGHRKLGYSPLYSVTFPNKSYDERMAKILEWQAKVLPKVILKSGGGLAYGEISDEPAQELIVNPGGEPEVMEFRQPPSSFFTMLQNDISDMYAAGGYQIPTQTQQSQPGQVSQFNRIRTPIEPRGSTQTSLAHINAKPGWQEAGEIIIAYVSKFYTEPRMVSIQGPDKLYQWQEFKGTDLNNIAAAIRVDEASLFPWNRQELRDSMIAMLGTDFGGMVLADSKGNPDPDKISAVLNATGMDVAINALDADVMEARNIISEFKNMQQNQQPPEPKFWQDIDVHFEEYVKILKSKRFQSWEPNNQQAFLQYVQGFSELLNQQAEEEATAMVEQEKALRGVREQVEVQGDIQKMVAELVIGMLEPVIGQLLSGNALVDGTGVPDGSGIPQVEIPSDDNS